MKWSDRTYFGTWQLSGQFKELTDTQIEDLVQDVLTRGVYRFDTAAVYGQGNVERILGACLPQEAVILTKIPAKSKPDTKTPIDECYSRDVIYRSVDGSLKRLGRDSIDTFLLHNWLSTWQHKETVRILDVLNELRETGVAKRVGISIPNGFSGNLNDVVLERIDVIEAPYNPNEQWVTNQLPIFKRLGKEVLLRSLFLQGKLIVGTPKQFTIEKILENVLALDTSVVIGMTTTEQITCNINYLKGAVK